MLRPGFGLGSLDKYLSRQRIFLALARHLNYNLYQVFWALMTFRTVPHRRLRQSRNYRLHFRRMESSRPLRGPTPKDFTTHRHCEYRTSAPPTVGNRPRAIIFIQFLAGSILAGSIQSSARPASTSRSIYSLHDTVYTHLLLQHLFSSWPRWRWGRHRFRMRISDTCPCLFVSVVEE
jgi:hypothetical protein